MSYVYLEVVSVHFSKITEIPLHYDNGFIFIQTDESVYNSDQSGIIKRNLISGGKMG